MGVEKFFYKVNNILSTDKLKATSIVYVGDHIEDLHDEGEDLDMNENIEEEEWVNDLGYD